MEQKIVMVNNHSYRMSKKLSSQQLKIAKQAMKGKKAIYALERGNIIEMRIETFKTTSELMVAVRTYLRKGILVHHTR